MRFATTTRVTTSNQAARRLPLHLRRHAAVVVHCGTASGFLFSAAAVLKGTATASSSLLMSKRHFAMKSSSQQQQQQSLSLDVEPIETVSVLDPASDDDVNLNQQQAASSSSSAPRAAREGLTSFLSDVEGNRKFWRDFLAISRVLYEEETEVPEAEERATKTAAVGSPSSNKKKTMTSRRVLKLKDGCKFVFGGDVFDKGDFDLGLARTLVQLKKDYPSRVALLVGNRDINKCKLTAELDDDFVKTKIVPEKVQFPYYMRHAPAHMLHSYSDFLEKKKLTHCKMSYFKWLLPCTMGCPTTFEFRRCELAREKVAQSGSTTSSTTLVGGDDAKSLFVSTTRSSDAGDDNDHGCASSIINVDFARSLVSDEEVLRSFEESLLPGGAVFEYMRHAQLAVISDNALFVHGGVTGANIGFVPSATELQEQPYAAVEEENQQQQQYETKPPPGEWCGGGDDSGENQHLFDVADWVEKLNQFHRAGFRSWHSQRTYLPPQTPLQESGDLVCPRGGAAWFAYAHQRSMCGRTVMVSTPLEADGPRFTPLFPVQCLNMSGVDVVVSGHQPTGDSPVVVQQPMLTTVVADSSYCDAKRATTAATPSAATDGEETRTQPQQQPMNLRGEAAHEVLVDGLTGLVTCHGYFADGHPYEFTVPEQPTATATSDNDDHLQKPAHLEHASIIGKHIGEGWWTKAVYTTTTTTSRDDSDEQETLPEPTATTIDGKTEVEKKQQKKKVVVCAQRTSDRYHTITYDRTLTAEDVAARLQLEEWSSHHKPVAEGGMNCLGAGPGSAGAPIAQYEEVKYVARPQNVRIKSHRRRSSDDDDGVVVGSADETSSTK